MGGLFRLIGLLILAVGFVFMVYDGARSIADQSLRLTRLDQTWSDINQASLDSLRAGIEHSALGGLWSLVVEPLLRQPTWAVLGVIGLLLMFLFRRRKPLIGYSRE